MNATQGTQSGIVRLDFQWLQPGYDSSITPVSTAKARNIKAVRICAMAVGKLELNLG
jgi:hypothetical protein